MTLRPIATACTYGLGAASAVGFAAAGHMVFNYATGPHQSPVNGAEKIIFILMVTTVAITALGWACCCNYAAKK